MAGEQWVNVFVSILPENEYKQAKASERKSKSIYRFGGSVETKGVCTIDLPVMISSKKHVIEVDVVNSDIPLLMSKPEMTKLGMKIDFSKILLNPL